jgi:TRAP-type C4-dicarboxylate transport system permease small subunit
MFKTTHRMVHGLSYAVAVVGGLALTAIILMVCLSILGRTASGFLYSGFVTQFAPDLANSLLAMGVGPVRGDYELLELGMAFCIFCFLPYCQVTSGHATVDIFTSGLSERFKRYLQMVIEITFAAVLVVVAMRLYDGMLTIQRRNSMTFMLQIPLWWSYLAAFYPAALAAAVGCYMALVRSAEALLNRPLIDASLGADH